MSNTLTIWRKELQSYFRSPIAYGVIAFFALIAGYMFYSSVVIFVSASIRSSMMGQSQPMNVNDYVIRPIFGNVSVIFLIVIPMIAMRLFAEEKRSGTIELLMTSPVKDWEIILGKWFAAMTLYCAMLLTLLISMASLFFYGQPDLRPMLTGFLGLLLLGGSMLSVGTFISTLTKNQIVAVMAAFSVCILWWILDWPASYFQDSTAGKILSYLAITQHLDSFTKGVLDMHDVVYYVSAIIIGLFLTARSLESLRWRA